MAPMNGEGGEITDRAFELFEKMRVKKERENASEARASQSAKGSEWEAGPSQRTPEPRLSTPRKPQLGRKKQGGAPNLSSLFGRKKQKRRRYRGRALTEIRTYQKSTDLLLLKAPFQRLVRQLTRKMEEDIEDTNAGPETAEGRANVAQCSNVLSEAEQKLKARETALMRTRPRTQIGRKEKKAQLEELRVELASTQEKAKKAQKVMEKLVDAKENYRWTRDGIEALQHAAEAYIVDVFESANLCTVHAKRVTLMPKDLHLAMRLRGLRNFFF
ncbi:histone H3 [Chloropicon primus]|uniref:Histone H3 n=1 Tax=Chloropicon primus TaxID=1764295 RepID=A0A5B8MU31_9CHLO|nr:histone H3 [Chloropicon primus]UPR03039.1 histone H3 [Chloropicon primus]|mmetsp:Transcript_2130/g.5789  ORF Transcript_2130/g.5789 Transcript_2130/m.5789 type:complete len:273 (+) Transcript_2130:402-1220(+)|eukprot:QDZ23826.1 histone H3 [Chloropicon primus]